ncbi:selenophosphate synthase [Garciella nitratireducens DSM 15102]|uniref:Selenide, water dikinase n=1 Tax=Garciella nitratireducens DSM 15102 TaxID=1121911 RepID=A0A1T4KTH4_9FIRM|nr:selenophosphate synthase [Garciella nitratireducens DSM 15102]
MESSDDAAIYKIDEQRALIQTLDFFTPVIDDPYLFGQIAAANSLSDVYAMGGVPLTAMNIVCFPNCLPSKILSEIIRGGADKIYEAGAVLVGGHSVEDQEPKYGLSVTGIVHPSQVKANSHAKAGDVLILTKPLGLGIINTAIKADFASDETIEEAIFIMSYLNKDARDTMQEVGVNGCTDITGFGLLGHAYEMASASNVSIEIDSSQLPIIKEAIMLGEMGMVPAGTYANRRYLKDKVLWLNQIPDITKDLLFDPQTSGGLLISIEEQKAQLLVSKLKEKLKVPYAIIGRVLSKGKKEIIVK